jgi:hypothetical protein
MTKYSNLKDEILKTKLRQLMSKDIDEETISRIKNSLDSFDRITCENLAIEVEGIIAENKKRKLEEEARIKAELDAKSKADAENEDVETHIPEVKKTFPKKLNKEEWTELKNSMGIFRKDEDDNPIFNSLEEQFIDTCMKLSPFYYKARYYDKSKFIESMKFKYLNLNEGFIQEFREINEYAFICFRLSIDPDTNECIYESWWIVNCLVPLSDILGSDYNYFEWYELDSNNEREFLIEMMKSKDPKYISELYNH